MTLANRQATQMRPIRVQFATAAIAAAGSRSSGNPNSAVAQATMRMAEKLKAARMIAGISATWRSCSLSEMRRALTSAMGAVTTKDSAKL